MMIAIASPTLVSLATPLGVVFDMIVIIYVSQNAKD